MKFKFLAVMTVVAIPFAKGESQQLSPSLWGKTNSSPPPAVREEASDTISLTLSQVSLPEAFDSIAGRTGAAIWYNKSDFTGDTLTRVTAVLKSVTISAALAKICYGTSFRAVTLGLRQWNIVRKHVAKSTIGDIVGVITDRRTHRPIDGATVTLDGQARGWRSDTLGQVHLSQIDPGTHILHIRRVGYRPATISVIVTDEQSSISIELTPSATALDQVIVTGTVVPTAERDLPNTISTISSTEIARVGAHTVSELFNGTVPGVTAIPQGTNNGLGLVGVVSRGVSRLGAGVDATAGNVKVYVDGVEMVDPSYMDRIDVSSIDHIEVLPGPQASTIYGSGAIGGVIQIFTKRGTTSRTVDAEFRAGAVTGTPTNENNTTGTSVGSLRVSGADSLTAYSVGGAWQYVGPWTGTQATREASGNLNLHRTLLPVLDLDMSTLLDQYWITGTKGAAGGRNPGLAGGVQTGLLNVPASLVLAPDQVNALRHAVLGLTLTAHPVAQWISKMTLGVDGISSDNAQRGPLYSTVADSLFSVGFGSQRKTQASIVSTVRLGPDNFSSIFVVGADGFSYSNVGSSANTTITMGSLASPISNRYAVHDAGGFAQWQASLLNTLYLTAGLRGEKNTLYGPDYGISWSPRIGISVVKDIGRWTLKGRYAYGQATQQPPLDARMSTRLVDNIFGSYLTRAVTPDLSPQTQFGSEGGFDLLFGNQASLSVTAYNQIVRNLITSTVIDSVQSLQSYPGYGYVYQYTFQYENVGDLRNRGITTEAHTLFGRISFDGSYTWQTSKLISYAPAYFAFITTHSTASAILRLGESAVGFPSHTGHISIGLDLAATNASVDVNYLGPVSGTLGSDETTALLTYGRLPTSADRVTTPGSGYRTMFPSTTQTSINISHRLSRSLEVVAHGMNVFNVRNQGVGYGAAVLGRQVDVGVRLHW